MDRKDERTEQIGRDAGAAKGRSANAVRAAGEPGAGLALLRSGTLLRDRRYVLDRRLGHGGMAAVWLGRDRRLRRPVAIKVLSDTLAGDSAYLSRFQREARIAAGLAHPNLIRIYDYGTEAGRPFLVMEYVAGGDVAERLAVGRPPDPGRLARELLDALRYIHDAEILHRDVKPQNVLLDRDGCARLTDFGIARPADATSLTQTGIVLGTARYMAPEVLAGEDPTQRSDLYSLGVVLEEVIAARGCDPQLARLVGALRADDPRRRPPSAAAAIGVLTEAERPQPHPAASARSPERTQPRPAAPRRPATSGPPARRPPPRAPAPASWARRLLAGAAVAAALLAVVAVAVIARGGDEDTGGGLATSDPAAEAGGQDAERRGEREPNDGRDGGQGEAGGQGGGGGEPEANGYELNDRGFALINEGRPAEAIPLLERAVEALDGSGDITYAYALYNLGHALRLAGRPEEAVPILEARLKIPNQTGVVRKELAAARAEAGLAPERPGRGRGRGGGDDD